MSVDFSQLYSQLGLEPGCTLEQLRHAYRKRVAELHPDRQASTEDRDGGIELASLITLYKMAMQFHDMHGRLPGSMTSDPGGPRQEASAAHRRPAHTASTRPSSPGAGNANAIPGSHWWLLLLVATLICYLIFSVPPEAREARPATTSQRVPETAVPARGEAMTLIHRGMDEQGVLAIQGQPTLIREDVWEYGPSWLRFEKGRVVEWHSSPLYRLKVAGQSGTPATE
jgi:hypothetical protein